MNDACRANGVPSQDGAPFCLEPQHLERRFLERLHLAGTGFDTTQEHEGARNRRITHLRPESGDTKLDP
ncbi:MAG: hypothetical protein ACRERV_12880 [Methylococcales bacterium]